MTHPHWCDRVHCDPGAHRSRPVSIDRLRTIRANLYAPAASPDVAFVEVHCGATVLPAREAYGLGRMLMMLGRVAEEAEESP